MSDFDRLVAEAEAQPFEGWDFSFIEGRIEREGTPWHYAERVAARARDANALVDLGTGGGEFLARVEPRPELTVATEGWMPNVPVADRNLRPLGIHVVAVTGAPDNADQTMREAGSLPFRGGSFDVVINRHESFWAAEVARILRPGGVFVTQQVGADNEADLNTALGAPNPPRTPDVDMYVEQLEGAGLRILDAQESRPRKTYRDIGAIVYNLLAMVDQVPGFSVATHRDRLLEVDRVIGAEGGYEVREHRLFFEAVKQ